MLSKQRFINKNKGENQSSLLKNKYEIVAKHRTRDCTLIIRLLQLYFMWYVTIINWQELFIEKM